MTGDHSHPPDDMSRRTVLKSTASAAISGVLVGATTAPCDAVAPSKIEANSAQLDVYAKLGVKRIINAAGTITTLGGSLMPPEVTAAWIAASKSFVNLLELQEKVGQRIAELLRVESALVTTGAAGGILLGTAAALTYRNQDLIAKLPLPTEMRMEVIRQKSHHACYDHQVTACGVKLIDVQTPEDLDSAINQRTAMMFSYNVNEGESTIDRRRWLDTARKHSIPTLLDAAADTPPLETLWKYNEMGYDMVVFSGGKAIQGPQDAGLLLGHKDLIEAARRNTSPYCGNIGRSMKVSKEDMVAMWAAVERFVKLDHDAQRRRWEERIAVIEATLNKIPTVTTKRIVPPIANHVPHLLVFWDQQRLSISYDHIKGKLASGDPSIATARVHGTGQDGFLLSVFMLQEGEDRLVAARMKEVLESG